MSNEINMIPILEGKGIQESIYGFASSENFTIEELSESLVNFFIEKNITNSINNLILFHGKIEDATTKNFSVIPLAFPGKIDDIKTALIDSPFKYICIIRIREQDTYIKIGTIFQIEENKKKFNAISLSEVYDLDTIPAFIGLYIGEDKKSRIIELIKKDKNWIINHNSTIEDLTKLLI